MRQALARVARGILIVTVLAFEIATALLVLFLVALQYGVQ